MTAVRAVADLAWRYLDCPYREQLSFYVAGPAGAATQALVMRQLPGGGARILDLFGDLDDPHGLDDLLRLALRDAAHRGATQVVALAAGSQLASRLRRRGFLLASTARFCWWSGDAAIMEAIARGQMHWCLGDSDNDEPC